MAGTTVYSLGHGERTADGLLECLRSFSILTVADVRSWPASRRLPWFDRERLEPRLAAEGLAYRWLGRELGGFRTDGYEAHMETDLFRSGIDRLALLAKSAPTAFLCAERDPVACHRRFISRVLAEWGFLVEHIVDPGLLLLPGERPGDQGTLFEL